MGSGYSSDKAQQVFSTSKKNPLHRRQNISLIWLDAMIDENSDECNEILTQLRSVIGKIKIFTDGDECINFLEQIKNEKIYMIISGSFGQSIVSRVHGRFQIDSIFIFCSNKKHHELWSKEWCKIKDVVTDIDFLCEKLKQMIEEDESHIISIKPPNSISNNNEKIGNQIDCSFMYTQILKEILLTIKFDDQNLIEFTNYCRDYFQKDDIELSNIILFEQQYHEKTPIWWYTYECFLYNMLNRALRTMDTDNIVKMGFYIADLHRQITKLHSKQFNRQRSHKTFTVYRGQGLREIEFEQMKKAKGYLMSFNSFLSTSKKRNVSLQFARDALENPNTTGILFVIKVDPSQSSTPFASINAVGYYGDEEDEILFSMHSVFRIENIKLMRGNQRLYQVDVILTSENDNELRILTERIRKDMKGLTGWYGLGEILCKMGYVDKADQIYQVLLNRSRDDREKADIYHQLGGIKDHRGEYRDAIVYYEKAIEIYQKILPSNHLSLSTSYNNIGTVYCKIRDYSTALRYYLKDLEITENAYPRNLPDLGISYSNIGVIYKNMGDYTQALLYYEKALCIRQESLPANHPDLAGSYNNLGSLYGQIGQYEKALPYFEKSLAIQQQVLAPNHPELAASYSNIGLICKKIGDYSKAHEFYQYAVAIAEQSLPSNHPHLRDYRNNLEYVKTKL